MHVVFTTSKVMRFSFFSLLRFHFKFTIWKFFFPFTLTKHSNVKQELNKHLYNQNTYVRSINWSFYFLIYMKMERSCDWFGKKNYSAQIHSLAEKTLCDWVITAWIAMQLWVQEIGLYAGVKWKKANNGKDKRQ